MASALDIVDVIEAQHRAVDTLLDEATEATENKTGDVRAIMQQIAKLLIPHSKAEESFVYPTISSKAPDAAEDVADGAAEHHHIEGLLQELLVEDPESPGYDGKLAAFVGELRHHVEEEESELLPALREKASKDELAALGERFETETGWDASAIGGDATKAELLDKARELDITGRSSMSKDELAQAVTGS